MVNKYRKVLVPVSMDVLQRMEQDLQRDLEGNHYFTCNRVAHIYAVKLCVHYSSREPQRKREEWGEFLYSIGVIHCPKGAIHRKDLPRWVKALHPRGTLNELRLALVRDIIRKVTSA